MRPEFGILDPSTGSSPGRIVEVRPGESKSILDVRATASKNAQSVTAQCAVEYAFGRKRRTPGGVEFPYWPDDLLIVPTVRAEWGVEGGATTADFDLVDGAAVTVSASFLRLTVSYPERLQYRPAVDWGEALPADPMAKIRVSASLGYNTRGGATGANLARLTEYGPQLEANQQPGASWYTTIPNWARSVIVLGGTTDGAIVGRFRGSPTRGPLALAPSVVSPVDAGARCIPSGAGVLDLENLSDGRPFVTLIWELGL